MFTLTNIFMLSLSRLIFTWLIMGLSSEKRSLAFIRVLLVSKFTMPTILLFFGEVKSIR